MLGTIRIHANDADGAVKSFLAGLKLEPGRASLLANCGYALLLKGDLESARSYLLRSVQIDGMAAEARNNLAIVLANLGDREGALLHFTAAGSAATAHNNLGAVYSAHGRWREAQREFRLALSLQPDYLKARQNLDEVESLFPPPTVVDLAASNVARDVSFEARSGALSVRATQMLRRMTDSGSGELTVPRGGEKRVDSFLSLANWEHPTPSPLSFADYLRRVFRGSIENAARHRPAFAVQVYATRIRGRAEAQGEQLARRGIRTSIERADVRSEVWYRLRIPGYGTFESALEAARKLAGRRVIRDYWIVRENS
jgi:tetratricopeptide (TPR) repeat protein